MNSFTNKYNAKSHQQALPDALSKLMDSIEINNQNDVINEQTDKINEFLTKEENIKIFGPLEIA